MFFKVTVGVFRNFTCAVPTRKLVNQSDMCNLRTFSLFFIAILVNSLSPVYAKSISRSARSLASQKSLRPYNINSKVESHSFDVYWNAPTFQCQQYGIFFDELSNTFGLKQNQGDTFRGDSISILYDPGKFPALLENGSRTEPFRRNGGLPQEGSLREHLDIFSKHIEELIPNKEFNGLGIIDFESWRPIFRHNFGKMTIYKDISYQIEKDRHNQWSTKMTENEAVSRFEKSGRGYVEQTLAMARRARPYARWGYYAYPYCFNMSNGKIQPDCSDAVVEENNDIHWLWDESDILLPSVYMGRTVFNTHARLQLVQGRVTEALRIAKRSKLSPTIYPYIWFKYNDDDVFLEKEDWYNSLSHMNKSGLGGAVIWGSSNDVSTKSRCLLLKDYVNNILGPIVQQFVPIAARKVVVHPIEEDLNGIINEITESTLEEIKYFPSISSQADSSYVNNNVRLQDIEFVVNESINSSVPKQFLKPDCLERI